VNRPDLIENAGAAYFSASTDGSIVYVSGIAGGIAGEANLYLVDKGGVRKALNIEADAYNNPRISPDGKALTVSSQEEEYVDKGLWKSSKAGLNELLDA
jgi:Tol biopolymer transport system component